MNKVILSGRATADADVRYSQDMAIARFTMAVDRKHKKDAEASADFPTCVAFGKTAEFLEKYGKKGTKFILTGRLQTGSYTNKDGARVYTTDVVVEDIEFAESKNSGSANTPKKEDDGFTQFGDFPVEVEDDDLPFAPISR